MFVALSLVAFECFAIVGRSIFLQLLGLFVPASGQGDSPADIRGHTDQIDNITQAMIHNMHE